MLDSTAKIIPVFYQVKPSDLRHIEKGAYAQAFSKHKNTGRYDDKKINAWMEALRSLSLIAGEEFYSEGDCQNIVLDCQKIVAAAEKEVQRNTYLHVAEYPVGLNNLVEDFQKRCLDKLVEDFENQFGRQEGKRKAQVVAIFGMGGVGKTTLAKELLNRKRSQYSRASFLFDVREASVRSQLPSLQRKLLQDLFNDGRPSFTSTEEGISYLKDCLQRTPSLSSLIVVDDIDHVEQLNSLAVMDISHKSDNNLVIVTTRDVGVLITAGINDGYKLKGMGSNYATELFCWHAFRRHHPYGGYEVLVQDFVDVCGGLPLSLQVLGRHVHGRAHSYWRSELIKVKKILPRDIKQRLRISFDALDDEDKQVFMDVACFFLGKPKRIAERIFQGSEWDAQHALETLKDRCLVVEEESSMEIVLRMHDHLRDLGREMALELSSPRRLWRPQELKSLELMGLKTILAKTNARCFHSIFDKSMGSLVTFFLGHSDFCVETSASVLWLELEGNSTKLATIPSWIPLQNLHYLEVKRGRLKTLWENQIRALSHLKELNISVCPEIKELACLSGLSCLENIAVDMCEGLQRITLPTKVFSLTLQDCGNLYEVSGTSDLMELRKLTIKKCPELEELPNLSRASRMENIEVNTCEKLQSITLPTTLFSLSVENCRNLKRVSGTDAFKQLTKLNITECPVLEEIPSVSSLSCLKTIQIKNCEEIDVQSITLPPTLFNLYLQNCRNLQRVSGSGYLMELNNLSIRECPELEELPNLSRVSWMENIEVNTCEKLQSITLPTAVFSLSVQICKNLQRVSGTSDLMDLTKLTIRECPELELLNLSRVRRMENIEVNTCEKLQSITLPTAVFSLSVQICKNLQRVSGTGDFMELNNLTIRECPELEELPNLSRGSWMENIEVYTCEKLQSITLPTAVFSLSVQICKNLQRVSGTSDLMDLTKLTIRKCPELEELPNLSRVSCMENIEVNTCDKLQSITLPTALLSLSLQICRNLQRVSGTDAFKQLTKLNIIECPMLEEFPSVSNLSCLKTI